MSDRWLAIALVVGIAACAPGAATAPTSRVVTSAPSPSAAPARLEPATSRRVMLSPEQLQMAETQREAAAQYEREHPPEPWVPPDLARW